ncbi:MAG: chorismate mutase AroQ, gamma subclass [SAR86 cluster bacterium]|uniref:chorismate mutase n=1 Tax=SAR86 cluster bacterium TaxID=2030880 RepID=A0A2A5AZU3_9GAMM|nr:MAG: chorismate mutase AroQ, gamma subclass [SAR86 cluster bacterium]
MIFPHTYKLTGLFSVLLFFSSISSPVIGDTMSDLFSSIDQRLAYMESVALFKAENQLAIEDIERELIVIADAKHMAETEGLSAESVADFFTAQIAVAKAIQYRYRAELLSSPGTDQAVDLNAEIRPALTLLGNRIVVLLAKYLEETNGFSQTHGEQFNRAITSRFVLENEKSILFNALLKAQLK